MKKKLPVLLAISFVAFIAMSLVNCNGTVTFSLADFINAPYGYVYASDGTTPIQGATVTVTNSAGKTVQSAVTTSSTGYWSLGNKVDTQGGTYTVTVTKTGYTFPATKITVADADYLYNCGVIKAVVGFTVSGKVVDIGATAGNEALANATVTLTSSASGATPITATTDSTGGFTATNVVSGTYTVTASKTGYTFIGTTVNVTGASATLTSDLLGYTTPSNLNQILVIVKWDNTDIDVDSSLVIDDYNGSLANTTATTANGFYSSASHVIATIKSDLITSGASVYPAAAVNATPFVKLDRDIYFPTGKTTLNGYPAETIRIAKNPFAAPASGTITAATASAPGSSGWLRYYIRSYSKLSTTGSTNGYLTGDPTNTTYAKGANAIVYVQQGTTTLGTFPIALNTAEQMIGVLKIQVVATSATVTDYYVGSYGNPWDGTSALNIAPVSVPFAR